jgi:hypothetical protein
MDKRLPDSLRTEGAKVHEATSFLFGNEAEVWGYLALWQSMDKPWREACQSTATTQGTPWLGSIVKNKRARASEIAWPAV